MKFGYVDLNKLTITLVILAAIIDPIGNLFGLRYLAIIFSFINVILMIFKIKFLSYDYMWRGSFIIILTFIMPIYALSLYSIFTRGGVFIDTSYIASGILILYSLLYYKHDLAIFALMSMLKLLRVLVLIIIISALLQSLGSNELLSFFTERNIAIIGFREYGSLIFPYIYFLSSPMILFLLIFDLDRYLKKRNFLRLIYFVTTSSALILSGTRAHVLLPFLTFPLYIFLNTKSKSRIIFTSLTFILSLTLLISNRTFLTLIAEYLSKNEASNEIKISMLSKYSKIFNNPFTFLFGQGYNAHEWSSILRTMINNKDGASKTELTYFEIIRVYGLFLGTTFLGMLAVVLFKLKTLGKHYYWLFFSFLIYLINSSINPYLFSSNGMIPLGIILSIIYFESKHNKLNLNADPPYVN